MRVGDGVEVQSEGAVWVDVATDERPGGSPVRGVEPHKHHFRDDGTL